MATIKVGDTVKVRPGFGMFNTISAVVRGLEITDQPRSKYGIAQATEVSVDLVKQNRVLFSFDNQWAYSDQIVL